MVKTTMTLPTDLWKRAKMHALETDLDLTDVVVAALEAYLKRQPKKGGIA
jgi:hypothetical protein